MADLGSIATIGLTTKRTPSIGPSSILHCVKLEGQSYYAIGGKSTTEGNPSPCLQIATLGSLKLRWRVTAGNRSVQVQAMQAVNLSPRPRMTVIANAAIGVSSNVSASASTGSGWTTVGPIAVTITADGVLEVLLENLLDGIGAPCYFDNLITT